MLVPTEPCLCAHGPQFFLIAQRKGTASRFDIKSRSSASLDRVGSGGQTASAPLVGHTRTSHDLAAGDNGDAEATVHR